MEAANNARFLRRLADECEEDLPMNERRPKKTEWCIWSCMFLLLVMLIAVILLVVKLVKVHKKWKSMKEAFRDLMTPSVAKSACV